MVVGGGGRWGARGPWSVVAPLFLGLCFVRRYTADFCNYAFVLPLLLLAVKFSEPFSKHATEFVLSFPHFKVNVVWLSLPPRAQESQNSRIYVLEWKWSTFWKCGKRSFPPSSNYALCSAITEELLWLTCRQVMAHSAWKSDFHCRTSRRTRATNESELPISQGPKSRKTKLSTRCNGRKRASRFRGAVGGGAKKYHGPLRLPSEVPRGPVLPDLGIVIMLLTKIKLNYKMLCN